ncbi:hypothetical protein [Flintibacter faecis]|uniref:Uncharacterized protein n=1 Tax=Flintibacter faecis TaxID=2763047 RepID=A0A8J6J485_9FIRM|nr:hypothetical protein [Flintibacter faecis]MBC5716652.1 hypothetical protein [Flintibacter faecis]
MAVTTAATTAVAATTVAAENKIFGKNAGLRVRVFLPFNDNVCRCTVIAVRQRKWRGGGGKTSFLTKEKDKKHEVLIYRTMYRVNLRKMHETMQNRAGAISPTWVEKGVEARIFRRRIGEFPRKWNGLWVGGTEFNLAFSAKGVYDRPREESRRSFVLRPGF